MSEIIKFVNVIKKFGNTLALNKETFSIKSNQSVALIGNNGAGKTTTINVICNLIRYDKGEVYVFGKLVMPNYVEYKNKLGIILSKPIYIEEFTVQDYWKFVCKFQRVENVKCKERTIELAHFLGIEDSLKSKIKKLSSGNQTKVSIGASLIHNPEVLIYDEPFTNLDINTTQQLIKLIKEIKKNKTIFISSHSLDLVVDLCESFLIMDKGKIILEVKKNDFSNNEDLKIFIKSKIVNSVENADLEWLK